MIMGNDLNRIGIYISKLAPNDTYKAALEKEYHFYREVLEAFPADSALPEELISSIYSLLQRIKNYVVFGNTSNPLVPIVPYMTELIDCENDKEKIIAKAKTNPSFIANRRQKLAIFKQLLDAIDYGGERKDIRGTIDLATTEYEKSNIYASDFEQEIAKAKYFYMIRLIMDDAIDDANILAQDFETDMLLFMHLRHKDSVSHLLKESKAMLANEMYHFLNEFQDGKIHDIEFWKILAQIENPEWMLKEERKEEKNQEELENETSLEELIMDKEPATSKHSLFEVISRKRIERKFYTVVSEEHEYIHITLKHFQGFIMPKAEIKKLNHFLRKLGGSHGEHYKTITIQTFAYNKVHSYDLRDTLSIRHVIECISYYLPSSQLVLDFSYCHTTHIPQEFFENLSITKVVLPYDLQVIEDFAFHGCKELEEVIFPEKLLEIRTGAFLGCFKLKQADLSKTSLKKNGLKNRCFESCTDLEKVLFNDELQVIGEEAFRCCESLRQISLKNVSIIEPYAFLYCYHLGKVEETQNLTMIGTSAFKECKNLKHFNFPTYYDETELIIEEEAFALSGLKKMYMDCIHLSIGEGIFKNTNLKKAEIHSTITSLPESTFEGCSELEEVILPANLETLEEGCFKECISLKVIDLPKSLKRINRDSFRDCEEIEMIHFSGQLEYVGDNAFCGCDALDLKKLNFMTPID
ncbi:MAG: leucine-rich repeat domain-containing protein [Clostridia bacterium]|nr:leucine-rich repeat domain-containing protein [Clostridia bacterium]